jgi:glycosyltransferase involved in cell wall biosynthesis
MRNILIKAMIKKKILFVCPFPVGVQAGQRLKYEQHFKLFNKNGYDISISPFIDYDTYKIIYKKGFFVKKIYGLIKGYYRRFSLIKKLDSYDIIYIFMWVTPFLGSTFEKIYFKKSKKVIYDIEDNILIKKINNLNKITFFLKNINKFIYLISNADHIITSAPGLLNKVNNISKKNNSTYICASIEISRYINTNPFKQIGQINIGWTGTFSSMEYLSLIEPVLIRINKIRKIKFIVISNTNYYNKDINYESIIWSKNREINDLSKIDIGIYPLPMEDDWVLGKSGLKSLQYMAMGIPSISSNVGNIKNIITNYYDGILVNNEEEWFEMLIKLIDSKELRDSIAIKGQLKVKNEFSVEVLNKKYINIFNNI